MTEYIQLYGPRHLGMRNDLEKLFLHNNVVWKHHILKWALWLAIKILSIYLNASFLILELLSITFSYFTTLHDQYVNNSLLMHQIISSATSYALDKYCSTQYASSCCLYRYEGLAGQWWMTWIDLKSFIKCTCMCKLNFILQEHLE